MKIKNTQPFFPDIKSHDPLSSFLGKRSIQEYLSGKFVFIHNKLKYADLLLELCKKYLSGSFTFQIHDTSASLEKIKESIKERKNVRGKEMIYIVDFLHEKRHLESLLKKPLDFELIPYGLWIRGYLGNIPKSTISIFDLHFLFDMSSQEVDIIKSIFPRITNDLLKDMKDGQVVTFLNTKEDLGLTMNPIVLKLAEDTVFVPDK